MGVFFFFFGLVFVISQTVKANIMQLGEGIPEEMFGLGLTKIAEALIFTY